MKRTTLPALVLAALLTVLMVGAAHAADPVTVMDLLNLRTVSSIDVSRDGSIAVIAVRSIAAHGEKDGRPDYRNQSHLWSIDLLDLDAEPRQLTFGDRNDSAPDISPDGRHVGFLRTASTAQPDDEDPAMRPQVWVMDLKGGEARPVTELENGAGRPQWSPGGDKLLTTTSVPMDKIPGQPSWSSERPGEIPPMADDVKPRPDGNTQEIRAYLKQNAERQDPYVIDRLAFQGERSLRRTMEFRQLVIVDVAGDLPSAKTITSVFRDHDSARFTPDGQSIVYATRAVTDRHPDHVRRNQIRRVSIDGRNDHVLLDDPEWSYNGPLPSRDGSVIAFRASRTDEPTYRQERLGLATISSAGASEPMWLTTDTTFDHDVGDYRWLSDRAGLAFTTYRHGGIPLMAMNAGLIQPAVIVDAFEDQPVGVYAFDIGGPATVYAMTSPQNPCVVRVRDTRGDRVVLDLNQWVRDRALSMPNTRWITRPDGTRVQYWLMKPTRYIAGQTYPLAVEMHGGPSAMWGPGELSMWLEFQVLCGRGFGVVYANPRGSGGYGYEFQKGNHQNWGEGPGGDVLAAVDHASLDPWVDADRLVLTGGSYAGYLTAWIVAHDHRFKAAVAQRGVYELTTFFGEGNAWRLVEYAFGGYPWEPEIEPILRRESPFTYVQRIRTPLLILHASNDLRTGVSQSEMLYRALKVLNRPVEYVRYPRAGHDLSRTGDPTQRIDRILRIVEFFERFVK